MLKIIWEPLASNQGTMMRAKVLGGWLVKTDDSNAVGNSQSPSVAFVPDPSHAWVEEVKLPAVPLDRSLSKAPPFRTDPTWTDPDPVDTLIKKGFPVETVTGPSRYDYELEGQGYTLTDLAAINRDFSSFSEYKIHTVGRGR